MTVDTASAYGTSRVTRQRRVIAESVASMPGAFSVEDVAAVAREHDGGAGIATVYRAVAAMLSNGWLERVGERGGSALFVRCDVDGRPHHHHVVCDGCGRVVATRCPEAVATGVETPEGFVITRHEITLYGLCPSCAPLAEKRRR